METLHESSRCTERIEETGVRLRRIRYTIDYNHETTIPSFTRFGAPALALAQDMRQDTYCNPLNIDYTYMIYNSDKDISYRSGADPAVVRFRGEYYMFVTRSNGYWHSKDLLDWDFIAPKTGIRRGATLRPRITIKTQCFMSPVILRVL